MTRFKAKIVSRAMAIPMLLVPDSENRFPVIDGGVSRETDTASTVLHLIIGPPLLRLGAGQTVLYAAYTSAYADTDRQAASQTDRQTYRQTDRQTDRQTGRQTDR